jgi:hypothetical protein
MQKTKTILKVEHDIEPCAHIPQKKRSKPLAKSFGTKKIHKSSYTILEGPLEEKCGE